MLSVNEKDVDILDVIKNKYDLSDMDLSILDSFLSKYNHTFNTNHNKDILLTDDVHGSLIDTDVIKIMKSAMLSFYATNNADISRKMLNDFISCKVNGNNQGKGDKKITSFEELPYVEKVMYSSKIITEFESNKRDLFHNYDSDLYRSSLCFLFEEFDKTHY